MRKLILIYLVLFSLIPVFSYAQTFNSDGTVKLDYAGLVKCDGVVDKSNPKEVARDKECNFNALVGMAGSIINWLFALSIPIFVGLCAYAGFLYMTPNPANRAKGNSALWAALKGFAIMLIAWFAVTTILGWIVRDTFKDTTGSLLKLEQK